MWRTFERALRGDRAWFERSIDAMAADVDKSILLRSNVAFFQALFGRLEHARACYAPLLAPPVLDAHDEDWLMTIFLTAEAVAACGDREAAALLYPRLLPHRKLNVAHLEWFVYFGAAAHALGLLAELLGEHAAAGEHFELALEVNARLGARPALARSSFAYGRMLLARERGGGPAPRGASRGHTLLRDAADLAREIGLLGLREDAQRLLD
jgi:tetratricopeptide (TPR) repeat protein